jgi:hypothetical protein
VNRSWLGLPIWFIVCGVCLIGCTSDSDTANPTRRQSSSSESSTVASADHSQPPALPSPETRAFCGNCHAFPDPSSFPKSRWYEEVRRGFDFYQQSGRSDLKLPSLADVVAWYHHQAPENLSVPDQAPAVSDSLNFTTTDLRAASNVLAGAPCVSFVEVRPGPSPQTVDLWISDMKHGAAFQLTDIHQLAGQSFADGTMRYSFPFCAKNPAVVRQVDLDGNGVDDLLIADLGSFLPEDHDRGQVVWIPDAISDHPRTPIALLTGAGRVADVQTGDFDGDGRLDVIVAAFGWHKTGGLILLTNAGAREGVLQFEQLLLEDHSGAIHVIPEDLDRDGRLDLIVLYGQQFEQVTAYFNRSDRFEKRVLYEAPDPSWGSSGLSVCDIEGDGDTDLLYTNGDSFDSQLIKPYHGIWVLENQGSAQFTARRIAALPGVHRAIAADLDQDGDLDIAATAMLPKAAITDHPPESLQAVIWLEQTGPGEFARHVIEFGVPRYASMTIGDVNGDDRPDIIAGVFQPEANSDCTVARIFWNQRSGTKHRNTVLR